MNAPRTRIYTDGACSGNPGPGGWAWVVPDGPWAAGPAADTTNQRMELEAVLEAVRYLPGSLHIVSDSTYVVNCFRDGWWQGWIKRGWKNTAKKPVANQDLWKPLVDLYRERDVTFEWVKGHSGDEWNDVADRLAVAAATSQEPLHGTGRPGDLGPADAPGGSASATPRPSTDRPPGHLLAVAGHRPPEIGGYGPNPLADRVRNRLRDVLAAKAMMHDDLVVLSGLGLGAEQMGAEIAMEIGVPFIGVLAFPDPSSVWPREAQAHFDELLDAAHDVIVGQKAVPDTKPKMAAAMKRRDAWLARNGDEAVVVWDRSGGGVASLVRTLQASLGDDVWIVDPTET